MSSNLSQNYGYGPIFIRIALAAVFMVHGWGKLTGIGGTADFFGNVGIPLPTLSAWIVAIVEFFGGLLILLGYFTRIAASLIAVVMIVAILTVKLEQGFSGGWEFDFSLLMMAISLIVMGEGKLSLSGALK